MKIISINELQLDRILDSPFNPPSDKPGFSEESFYKEWKGIQEGIKSVLLDLKYCSWNDNGEDYTIADDWGMSRSHDVEIHNESMLLNKQVLFVIQQFINTLNEEYQVVVHHDIFLREEIPECYFIIQKEMVFAQIDDLNMRSYFNFDS